MLFHALHWIILTIFNFEQDLKFKQGEIASLAGGVEEFNLIATTSFFLIGYFLHISLHLLPMKTKSPTQNEKKKRLFVWRNLFEVLRGKIPPSEVGLGKNPSKPSKCILIEFYLIFRCK